MSAGAAFGLIIVVLFVLAFVYRRCRGGRKQASPYFAERSLLPLDARLASVRHARHLAGTCVTAWRVSQSGEPDTPLRCSESRLRVIKKEELRIMNCIGCGAFGEVFRGVWLPKDDPERQCPVAIKKLNETSPSNQQSFIEEAKNMAMVRHKCLVSLVAVCMAENPLLITPLMNHGSLSDYMRKARPVSPKRSKNIT